MFISVHTHFPSDFCCVFKVLYSRIVQTELTDEQYFAENFNTLLLDEDQYFLSSERQRLTKLTNFCREF